MINEKVLYIAGPMNGLPEFNHPAFHAAAGDLRKQGFSILSPAEIDNGETHKDYNYYLKKAIQMMLSAEAVVVLPGWEDSKGASIEVSLAQSVGLPVYIYPALEPYKETILETAARVVDGPRQQAYGHPIVNHGLTASLWSAYKGFEITPTDVCLMMILQKVSRERNSHKLDNLVDIAGYARNAEMVLDYESS